MNSLSFEVRRSAIHGVGGFATRRIRRGSRIIEYAGQRIGAAEGDRRYQDLDGEHAHVLLFVLDRRTVIDGGVGGNEARFINHSCEPNCRSVVVGKHVYIEAIRPIASGEELTYDYNLTRDVADSPEMEAKYVCFCGAKACRGTMLAPAQR